MTDGKFDNFKGKLNASDKKDKKELDDEVEEKEEDMAENQKDKDKKEQDKARKEASDRMNKVMSSEHYQGQEKLAAALLSKDISAEDINDILETSASNGGSASDEDSAKLAEDAAKKVMSEAINDQKNSDIEEGQETSAENDADIMKGAIKSAQERR